ncbi:protein NDRG3 [Biomphalaria glabrata]|nr:protein NDRG3 [Biomphalaria glabrata]
MPIDTSFLYLALVIKVNKITFIIHARIKSIAQESTIQINTNTEVSEQHLDISRTRYKFSVNLEPGLRTVNNGEKN